MTVEHEPVPFESEYLRFYFNTFSSTGKTSVWNVQNTSSVHLGRVRWFGSWRQYVFFTASERIILNKGCLRDIARFCEEQTNKQFGRD